MNAAAAGASLAPLAPDDLRAAVPLYTINEAARYLATPYMTLLRWVRPDEGNPLVSAFPKHGHRPVLPFIGFAEAFVLSVGYHAGMKPHRILENIDAIRKKHGVKGIEHVLASRLLFHDGAEFLLGQVPDDPGDLSVARSDQIQMRETVEDQLRMVTLGDDGFAERIALPVFKRTRVIVDPREAFGRPIVERTGTRVDDVLGLFWAGEEIKGIAYDFDLEEAEVQDLIRAQTKPTS